MDGFAGAARFDNAHHRVVVAGADGAVVAQERVGHGEQLLVGILVVDDDGLVVDVARGHHQHRDGRRCAGSCGFALGAALGTTARFREVVQQQMLEGRVGQHDAEFGEGVGQAGSKNSIGALAQQHDGALRGREDALLRFARFAIGTHGFHIGHHDGERLALAALARAQQRHRFGVRRVTHQMETAQALHGQDLARQQQFHGARKYGIALLARGSPGDGSQGRVNGIGSAQCFT